MMHPPPGTPPPPDRYGTDTGPHWAAMSEHGGPTWADAPDIARWRAATFRPRGREERYMHDDEGSRGMFGEVNG